MVRVTTSRGCLASRDRAAGVWENSWYASSTTTTASVAEQTASITSRLVQVPVGLFGVVITTTVGLCLAIAESTRPASTVKSWRRGSVT